MIHQYYQPPNLPLEYWTPTKYDQFKDLLKVAEEYDEKTGQKDCLDPKKAEFLKDVEKLLEEKYGIVKKFDWQIGDTVCTLKSKPVISESTFMTDLTLREGLVGTIAKIEHNKTQVTVWVQFTVIKQLVPFRGDVSSETLNEQLRNEISYLRKLPWTGGNITSSTGGTGRLTANGVLGEVTN
jgi:hypothetical protein